MRGDFLRFNLRRNHGGRMLQKNMSLTRTVGSVALDGKGSKTQVALGGASTEGVAHTGESMIGALGRKYIIACHRRFICQ